MSELTHLTQENFKKEVIESNTPVVIDFWAEWCGPCRMMGPVFEELSKEYEGKLKFVKLNTEDEPELAGSFQIRGIPTLSIVKGDREINRIVGFLPKQALKQQLDKILASA
jgi:thioredoxin 1